MSPHQVYLTLINMLMKDVKSNIKDSTMTLWKQNGYDLITEGKQTNKNIYFKNRDLVYWSWKPPIKVEKSK